MRSTPRMFLSILVCSLALLFLAAAANAQEPNGNWPTLGEQLAKDNIDPNSALGALVASNQDFARLRDDEKKDKVGLPPWFRVFWRKEHSDGKYSASDPTGGYPRV